MCQLNSFHCAPSVLENIFVFRAHLNHYNGKHMMEYTICFNDYKQLRNQLNNIYRKCIFNHQIDHLLWCNFSISRTKSHAPPALPSLPPRVYANHRMKSTDRDHDYLLFFNPVLSLPLPYLPPTKPRPCSQGQRRGEMRGPPGGEVEHLLPYVPAAHVFSLQGVRISPALPGGPAGWHSPAAEGNRRAAYLDVSWHNTKRHSADILHIWSKT